MNKIKVMSQELANQIAAGEVIENIASVVKELIENSIDAKATKIEITLIDSGLQLIQVRDNGIGISKDDLPLAIKQHATSKLTSKYDLFNIASLGFRGEALSSIVSVAKVKITSNNQEASYQYDAFNEELCEVVINPGTRIEVYNLFYNVPARLKYLNNQKSELANIIDLVSKYALIYSDIAFSLINDQKRLVTTLGNSNLNDVISSIYSLDIAQNMLGFDNESTDFKISGYVSDHQITRSNKKGLNIFINQRLVKDKELENAVLRGYNEYLMEKRYPIVVLNIECDYQLIDVNVHPAKKEVRISKKQELETLITTTINKLFNIKQKCFTKIVPPINLQIEPLQTKVEHPTKVQVEAKQTKEEIISYEPVEEIISINEAPAKEVSIITDEVVKPTLLMQAIGQFNATYILAQSQLGLHLVDQHAAMERINYQKRIAALQSNDIKQKDLLVPYVVDLTLAEKTKIISLAKTFKEVGLFFEEVANNDLILRSIPDYLSDNYVNELQQCIEYVLNNKKSNLHDFKKEEMILASCKTSLKANHPLSLLEQQALLEQLLTYDNYDHCPHGRPIIITFSVNEVERMFKRQV